MSKQAKGLRAWALREARAHCEGSHTAAGSPPLPQIGKSSGVTVPACSDAAAAGLGVGSGRAVGPARLPALAAVVPGPQACSSPLRARFSRSSSSIWERILRMSWRRCMLPSMALLAAASLPAPLMGGSSTSSELVPLLKQSPGPLSPPPEPVEVVRLLREGP